MLMRRIAVALGVTAVAVLPAPAARADEPPALDAAFVQAAYQSNLAEIQGGRVAWQKTTDPAVKDLAASLMRDHIHMNADLYQVARDLRIVLPKEPSAEQQALTGRYQAAGADTFDEYFVSTQLAAHREASQLVSGQIDDGNQPLITNFAEAAAPIIERHQDVLRDLAGAEGIPGYGTGAGRP